MCACALQPHAAPDLVPLPWLPRASCATLCPFANHATYATLMHPATPQAHHCPRCAGARPLLDLLPCRCLRTHVRRSCSCPACRCRPRCNPPSHRPRLSRRATAPRPPPRCGRSCKCRTLWCVHQHALLRASTFMTARKCARTCKDLREPRVIVRVIVRVMWLRCTRARRMQLLGCWWCALACTP